MFWPHSQAQSKLPHGTATSYYRTTRMNTDIIDVPSHDAGTIQTTKTWCLWSSYASLSSRHRSGYTSDIRARLLAVQETTDIYNENDGKHVRCTTSAKALENMNIGLPCLCEYVLDPFTSKAAKKQCNRAVKAGSSAW